MDRIAALLRNAVANNSYFCLSWVGWVDINIPRCLPRSLSNQGQWIKLCLLNRIHWIQYSMSSLMWTLGRCWDQSHRQTRGFLNTNWFSNLSPVILGTVSVTMRTLSQTPAPRLRRMLSSGAVRWRTDLMDAMKIFHCACDRLTATTINTAPPPQPR